MFYIFLIPAKNRQTWAKIGHPDWVPGFLNGGFLKWGGFSNSVSCFPNGVPGFQKDGHFFLSCEIELSGKDLLDGLRAIDRLKIPPLRI